MNFLLFSLPTSEPKVIPPGLRLGPPVHKITPSYRRMETPATRLESYRRMKSSYDSFLSTLKPPNQLLVAQIDAGATPAETPFQLLVEQIDAGPLIKTPFQLLIEQIDAGPGDTQAKTALKEAALRDKVEKHNIFMQVLFNISFYKPSSREWASLVEICDGKDRAYDIAKFLADKTFLATRQPFA